MIPEVPWQRPGQPQQGDPFDWIGELDAFFIVKVVIEATDADEVAVDRLGRKAPVEKVVDIGRHLVFGDLLNGHINPQHEVFKQVQVVLHGVRGIVPPLQKSPVVHDRIREGHRVPPSLSFPWP